MFQNTADMPRIGKELDRLKIIWRSKNLSIRNYKESYQQYPGTYIHCFLFRLPSEVFNFFTGPFLTLQGSSAACSVSTSPSPGFLYDIAYLVFFESSQVFAMHGFASL